MRKGLIIGLAAAAIALAAISCSKEDNTLRYNNMTMGNITEGAFISDQGNKFNVTEYTCPGKLDTMKRAFILCDVLKKTGTAENEYDVRVNYIANVLTKDAVAVPETQEQDTYGNDPIVLNDLWISGGYINMYVTFPVKAKDHKTHYLNLLHEKKDGVYSFQIRHDAAGEILKVEEDGEGENLVLAYAYASFPISKVISEETARYTISWNSYLINGNIISAKTETRKKDAEYKKSTFEQVPATAVDPEAVKLSLK